VCPPRRVHPHLAQAGLAKLAAHRPLSDMQSRCRRLERSSILPSAARAAGGRLGELGEDERHLGPLLEHLRAQLGANVPERITHQREEGQSWREAPFGGQCSAQLRGTRVRHDVVSQVERLDGALGAACAHGTCEHAQLLVPQPATCELSHGRLAPLLERIEERLETSVGILRRTGGRRRSGRTAAAAAAVCDRIGTATGGLLASGCRLRLLPFLL